ncbi:MAG: class IV adenylate cyclase [Anaerolineae bacterium]|nr:class IV adenylate cyclase [Anaerolineae bacterium]
MANEHNMLEIEAKLWVEDLAVVREQLEALGAVLARPRVFERNVRYDDRTGTLAPQGMVLRLRQDDRVRLTYKAPGTATTAGLLTRFEAEVEVSDFDTMDLILRQLGYRSFFTYEKYRTTYEFGGAEIVLDELPYGQFIEIEGEADRIEAIITALDLSLAVRFSSGYTDLFYRVRENLKLDFTDLTFANFAGITVPLKAFARLPQQAA